MHVTVPPLKFLSKKRKKRRFDLYPEKSDGGISDKGRKGDNPISRIRKTHPASPISHI